MSLTIYYSLTIDNLHFKTLSVSYMIVKKMEYQELLIFYLNYVIIYIGMNERGVVFDCAQRFTNNFIFISSKLN